MMITLEDLLKAFERNLEIIKMQTENLTHEQSLIQLPFRSNCLNWVVGHLLTNRCNILKLLEAEDIRPGVNLDHYERDSQPVTTDGEGVLPLDELIRHLEDTQKRLEAVLEQEDEESLQRKVSYRDRPEQPVAFWLFFLYYHDSYHTGQTEILRQAAGTDDKII
jgi:uncharacterized damage-inducible protein DinB